MRHKIVTGSIFVIRFRNVERLVEGIGGMNSINEIQNYKEQWFMAWICMER